jgi:hypothetical protein
LPERAALNHLAFAHADSEIRRSHDIAELDHAAEPDHAAEADASWNDQAWSPSGV